MVRAGYIHQPASISLMPGVTPSQLPSICSLKVRPLSGDGRRVDYCSWNWKLSAGGGRHLADEPLLSCCLAAAGLWDFSGSTATSVDRESFFHSAAWAPIDAFLPVFKRTSSPPQRRHDEMRTQAAACIACRTDPRPTIDGLHGLRSGAGLETILGPEPAAAQLSRPCPSDEN